MRLDYRLPTGIALLALSIIGCGGGGDGGSGPAQPPPTPGTLALSIPSPVASVTVGGAVSVALSITRGGSFTGSVTLSVTGAPAGVTATFVPSTLDGASTTALLNVVATATASAGASTLTVAASGAGVTTQTATVQLVVTQPSIALGVTPTAVNISAGQTGQATISIGRSAGFTGAVTLSLESPPAGIAAAFNASPTTANASVVTVNVASTVSAGVYGLTIKGSAPGALDRTVSLSLTVIAALPIGFTGTVDPVEFELPAGRAWPANGIVRIQRLPGFTGTVNVSVQGLSFPAVVAPSPSVLAANQTAGNLLALTIDGTAPGLYSGVVRLTAPGYAEQQVPIRVRVSSPSTGSITWNFCQGFRAPRYMAVRDGNGPWQHVVPGGPFGATTATPATFSFNITQPTASVVLIGLGEKTSSNTLIEGHHWEIYHLTRQEVIDLAAAECVAYRETSTRRVTGSVTGYQSFDAILASVGRLGLAGVGSTGPLTTTLTGQNLAPGPFDLLLSRTRSLAGLGADLAVTSIVLRRGIDPASGATIPAIDFTAEGFSAASAVLTYANTGGEAFTNTMTFRTNDGLNAWLVAAGQFTNPARTWYGVPPNRLVAGDLHQVTATTASTTSRRQLIHYSREVQPRTLTFGPPLASPVAQAPPTSPWLLRFRGTLSADYMSRASIYLREVHPDPRTIVLVASSGYLGTPGQYDVSLPDLSALPGFTMFWYPRRGSSVQWTVTGGEGATGDRRLDTRCTLEGYCPAQPIDGMTYKSAQATGTITIP